VHFADPAVCRYDTAGPLIAEMMRRPRPPNILCLSIGLPSHPRELHAVA
jgi:hypothetical protein